VSDKAVVTALDLANELDVRFENSVAGGDGITVSTQSIELPGGDPNDPNDNITQFAIAADPSYGGYTPIGGIIMWSGSIVDIPTDKGWFLCNGQNGTPNLLNRFVIGSGSTYSVGATGGSANSVVVSHTHNATSTVSDPGHTHPYQDDARINSGIRTDLDDNMFWFEVQDKTTSPNTTGITVSTSITESGSSGTNANLPPYYALAYIMRVF
jgi:microcystin-dependent protein